MYLSQSSWGDILRRGHRCAAATAVLALILWSGASLRAQLYTGAISGTISDESLGRIPGATVTLTVVRTGQTRETGSDETGAFAFAGLEPGRYSLRIAMPSFRTHEMSNIVLQAGERLPLGTITLGIAQLTDTVEVTAATAVVKTESSERTSHITDEQVDNLLMLGRNVTALVALVPGISETAQTDTLSRSGGTFRALGSRGNTNNISVDGVQSTDIDNGGSLKLQTSADAVAEMTVLMSNYQAEYGSGSGAVVNIIQKSGTSDFHGLISHFRKHEQFDSNNFFNNRVGQPKPRTRTNTWTYNIGGPVVLGKWNRERDRLFFFWNHEFWPQKSGEVRTFTTPTLLERNGDFSQTLDTNGRMIVIRDPLTGQPFPGNRIPQNRIDPDGQALLKLFPEPNFSDRTVSRGAYNYVVPVESSFPNRLYTLKLDYNVSDNDQIYGTHTVFDERVEGWGGTSGAFSSTWPQAKINFRAKTSGTTARWTRIVSPTIVNELGFAWQRNYETSKPATAKDQNALLRETTGFDPGMLSTKGNPDGFLPRVSFGGVPTAAGIGNGLYEWLPFDTPSNVYTVTQSLTVNRGRHLFKAGTRLERFFRDINGPSSRFGNFEFGVSSLNPLDTNHAYANAALGVFQTYTESSNSPYHVARGGRYEFFVQDTWKVRPRLTLDYGMRFYYLIPSFMKDDAWAAFQPSAYDPTKAVQLLRPGFDSAGRRVAVHPVTGQIFPQAAIGAIAPGTGMLFNGMVSPKLDPSVQRGVYKNRGLHYAPRVGFAWDLFGTGKTAIRGGGGFFYNPMVIANYRGLTNQPPLIEVPSLFYGRLSDLQSGTAFTFPSNVRGTDFTGQVPTAVNFSLGVQHNIGFDTIVDVAYVGSLARHLSWVRNLNAIPFGANFSPANQDPTTGRPLPSSLLRPIPGYGDIDFQEFAGSSNYHSLQVGAIRQFSGGVSYGMAYTLSRSREYVSGDLSRISTLVPIREWDYGPMNMDQTHVLKVNWLWNLPAVSSWSQHALTRGALTGWTISGIGTFSSGVPQGVTFTTTTNVDFTGSPTDGARLDLRGDPALPKSDRTFSRNFRTEMFALPAIGNYGNAGKFPLRGPGINNWDIAIFKDFSIHQEMKLQIRCEVYNALNTTQFAAFDTNARFTPSGEQVNPRFGEYISARPPRRMQFAARFSF